MARMHLTHHHSRGKLVHIKGMLEGKTPSVSTRYKSDSNMAPASAELHRLGQAVDR